MAKIKRYNESRVVWGLILTLCFVLHVMKIWSIPFVDEIENKAYDMRLSYFMPSTIDPRIVIVNIDEKSLKQEGRWPWGRHRIAAMLDQLFDFYHVSVVGFDVAFVEQDQSSGIQILDELANGPLKTNKEFVQSLARIRPELEHDTVFANSISNRDVVLGYFFVPDISDTTVFKGELPPPAASLAEIDPRIPIPKARGYTANLPILQKAAANAGFIDKPLMDSDGVIRRVALLEQYAGEIYPSLSLAIVQTLTGGAPLQLNVADGYQGDEKNLGLESIEVGGLRVPVDARAGMLVPYRGRQGSFPYISAADVINGTAPNEELENTVVLVGSSAAGLLDLRSTPVQTEYPGVEVHANIISGILDENIIHQPDYIQGVEFVLFVTIGVGMLVILPWLSALGVTLVALSIVTALMAFNYFMWTEKVLVPLAPSVILVFLLFIQHSTYGYFFEQKTKARLHKSFGQYVPPELVEEMTHAGDDYSMEAQNKEMTVLFSDVRGFTSISESMEPRQLAELMNEMLTPMTRIIHQQRGTIDKYMGDAIMAFWGAPLPDADHAQHAVNASLQMVKALPEINRAFVQRGWPAIKIGVGINTGTMNVGNMGSEFRMAYTVLGDAVNLGSRLEGVTKKYGVSIIVNETTKSMTRDIVYRPIDRVRVVGKDHSVEIFEPLGFEHDVTTEQREALDRYKVALAQYRNQEWRPALKNFETLVADYPDEKLYVVYLERVQGFIQEKPDDDWDGVYALTSK